MNPSHNNNQDDIAPNLHKHIVRFWRPILSSSPIIIGFGFSALFLINNNGSIAEKACISVFVLYFGGLLAYILIRYLACYNQVIEISLSDDTFYFGDNISLNKYKKDDVQQVLIYQPGGVRKVHFFYVYVVTFKDGAMIKFSNMLISEKEIINSFSDNLIRYADKSPFWRL